MKKVASIVVVLIVVVGLAVWLWPNSKKKTAAPASSSSNSSTNSSSSSSSSSSDAVPTNAVSIVNMSFSPSAVSIPAGATVHWNNNDSMTHTVTADDGSFDSGNIAPGSSFIHTFDTAGTFSYHCKIHSSMTGKVVVR